MDAAERAVVGRSVDLRANGRLTGKLGPTPVVVFWHEGRAWALEDRCPHLGFPLHQGTVEAGMVTCLWHHARFDLASGCTLDPWADDGTAFDVAIEGDDVVVRRRSGGDPRARLHARLRDGLEQGITLVIAKAAAALLEAGEDPAAVVRTALDFGLANRGEGWGSGLTVLVAMANLLPSLPPVDRPAALVHALAFLSRDTRGHAPRFSARPLDDAGVPAARIADWYRRFVETRTDDAAERALATLVARYGTDAAADAVFAAATDHVFIDGGHTIDFANKALEAVALAGDAVAPLALTAIVGETCRAERSEESSEWRYPRDLAVLAAATTAALEERMAAPRRRGEIDVSALAWRLLGDDPDDVTAALLDAAAAGADDEELARAVAYAAALRVTRFHTQNDFGDWNVVHHSFTTANAVHQAIARRPTPELRRAIVHGALRVHLDRFLNVPAARLPRAGRGDLAELTACWEAQGQVDRAGAVVYAHLEAGGDRAAVVTALTQALLAEDAGFHWYQMVEAGARQAGAWPDGSEEAALVLAGVARFLAAHTPTRRELPTVIRTANRLRRGEHLYEDAS
jgi:nitrite reductase/ring-hydroxylating ferredoxin subunit